MNYTELYTISDDVGFMPASFFYAICLVAVLFSIYSFYFTDRDNYTHIICALISGLLSTIAGYNAYLGIAWLNAIDTSIITHYYRSGAIGGLLALFGVFMIAYSVVRILDIVNEQAEEHKL